MNEKILIIDDEPDILRLLSSVLTKEGYEILVAADGVGGFHRFQQEYPDLVITDVRMPGKDGVELLEDIKTTGVDVDVIILTGYSDEATAINCLRAGAYDYLLKPLEDVELMLVSIKRALHKRQLELKNRQLMRQLEEMAITDPLTGLFNFRHLHTCLDEEMSRSKRKRSPLCGAMLDIDHFKKINDTYGHLFGDYVLMTLADIMRRHLRAIDRLFRYGGEEFFILLPETGKEETVVAINRLMDTVRAHTFVFDNHHTTITVSIGCTLYPDHAKDRGEILKYADQALYQAKQAGRNRFVFSASFQK